VTGACLAIKKSLYEFVGGLDVEFTVAYNDVDFCLRVQQAGYSNVYCADAELYHFESKTRGDDQQDAKKAQRFEEEKNRLKKRWLEVINNDPYYSPHLTRDRENFSLRS
jgi:GT2 family glycosyltransferase